jgi:hypothetical protein
MYTTWGVSAEIISPIGIAAVNTWKIFFHGEILHGKNQN